MDRIVHRSNGTKYVIADYDVLNQKLSELDIFLHTRRVTIPQCRKLLKDEYGLDYTKEAISWVAGDACRYWKQTKRKRKSQSALATSSKWDWIKRHVELMANDLKGLSKQHAYELIRTQVSINESIMDGLPKRLRFWEHKQEEVSV